MITDLTLSFKVIVAGVLLPRKSELIGVAYRLKYHLTTAIGETATIQF